MPKVYIPNEGPHNYSGAKSFGELVSCSAGQIDRWDLAQMHRILSSYIDDSQPQDYILLTSLTSLCSIICSMFACKHGRLNLLIYRDGTYLTRELFFKDASQNDKPK